MKLLFSYPETNGTEHDVLEAGALGEVAQAAERSQGWMPMPGGPELTATAGRPPAFGETDVR